MDQQNRDSLNHLEQSGDTRSESHENQNDVLANRLAEHLEYYRDFLEQLLDLVRHQEKADVERMVSFIRSGASQREILTAIAEAQGESNHTGQDGHAGSL